MESMLYARAFCSALAVCLGVRRQSGLPGNPRPRVDRAPANAHTLRSTSGLHDRAVQSAHASRTPAAADLKEAAMTSLRTLSRLGLILIALLALAAAVSRSALADGPESEPGDLGLTQISGTLPEPETEGTAFIQWGGGTIYQLTARLAVNGCDLNLLWVWDSQQERYTAGYTFDGPSFLNKQL